MAEPIRPTPAPQQSRIPEFATREEEAAFWDSHDISDYWDELQPVEVHFAKNLADPPFAKAKPNGSHSG